MSTVPNVLPEDGELLRRFVGERSEGAFEELVRRHIGVVYAAARRMMRDGHLAEDVTQGVFIVLAQRAAHVRGDRPLAAWLHQVTVFACRNMQRADRERRKREEEHAMRDAVPSDTQRAVSDLEVHLDAALVRLPAGQREALLLRYAEGMPLEQVAAAARVPVETARKRVQRGLAELRKRLRAAGLANSADPGAALATGEGAKPLALVPGVAAGALAAGVLHSPAGLVAQGVLRTLRVRWLGKCALVGGAVTAALAAAFVVPLAWRGPAPGEVPVVAATGAGPVGASTRGAATAVAAEQVRVRELIYTLRYCVPTIDTVETYRAIRELVTIGKPAVPELCAELDRADRDGELRALAFTLRAIGDRRAVPALIRAYPRTAFMVSDYGMSMDDRDLWQFIVEHRPTIFKNQPKAYPEIDINRSSTEITDALEVMTGTTVGRGGYWGARDDSPEGLAEGKAARQATADLWRQYWEMHSDQFVTEAEAASVNLAARAGDAVAEAGEARVGRLFPTGAQVRLGPVREMILPPQGRFDQRAYLDFDGVRSYGLYEYSSTPMSSKAPSYSSWFEARGIDAYTSTSVHAPSMVPMGEMMYTYDPAKATYTHGLDSIRTRTWPIENGRWDTFEEEVHAGKGLDLGKWGPSGNFQPRDLATNKFTDTYPATFLILTNDGARGILQVVGSSDDPPGVKLRFRLYEGFGNATTVPAAAPRSGATFGAAVKVELASPASKDPCALDLDTGATRAADVELVTRQKGEMPEEDYVRFSEGASAWLAGWKGDLIVQAQLREELFAARLEGAVRCEVTDGAWEKLTPDEVLEIAGRREPQAESFVSKNRGANESSTYVFKTREGATGMIRVLSGSKEKLTVEYKLVKPAGAGEALEKR